MRGMIPGKIVPTTSTVHWSHRPAGSERFVSSTSDDRDPSRPSEPFDPPSSSGGSSAIRPPEGGGSADAGGYEQSYSQQGYPHPNDSPDSSGYDTPAGGQGGYEQQGYGAPAYGQPSYGAPAYGQPGYADPNDGRPKRNGMGIAALVLGILALLTSWTILGGIVFGLLAIVLGFLGRGLAKRGEATNGGMALAGLVTGLIGLLISVGLLVAGARVLSSDTGKQLTDCVSKAGNDQVKVAQCRQDFQQKVNK